METEFTGSTGFRDLIKNLVNPVNPVYKMETELTGLTEFKDPGPNLVNRVNPVH
jgi:hypothetical protein